MRRFLLITAAFGLLLAGFVIGRLAPRPERHTAQRVVASAPTTVPRTAPVSAPTTVPDATSAPIDVVVTSHTATGWLVGESSAKIVGQNGRHVTGAVLGWQPVPGCVLLSPAQVTQGPNFYMFNTASWTCPPGTRTPGATPVMVSAPPGSSLVDEGSFTMNPNPDLPAPLEFTATTLRAGRLVPHVAIAWHLATSICRLDGSTTATTGSHATVSIIVACSESTQPVVSASVQGSQGGP